MKETVAERWIAMHNWPQHQKHICPGSERRRLVHQSALPLKLIAHLCNVVIRRGTFRLAASSKSAASVLIVDCRPVSSTKSRSRMHVG